MPNNLRTAGWQALCSLGGSLHKTLLFVCSCGWSTCESWWLVHNLFGAQSGAPHLDSSTRYSQNSTCNEIIATRNEMGWRCEYMYILRIQFPFNFVWKFRESKDLAFLCQCEKFSALFGCCKDSIETWLKVEHGWNVWLEFTLRSSLSCFILWKRPVCFD